VPGEERLTALDQPAPADGEAARAVDQPPESSAAELVADVVADNRSGCGDGDHERKREPSVGCEGRRDDQARLAGHERTGRLGRDEPEEHRVADAAGDVDQSRKHRRKLAAMDPDRARELLKAERERIEPALHRLGPVDDAEPADEFDPANLAADLYQDELDESRAQDLRDQLAAVERAEARLAAGTYGLSIESGEAIPDERLEIIPTAERTAEEERARSR